MLFSIIIVSYNSKKRIEKTMKSVCNQVFKDYEVIIIDGNSTDESVELFKRYRNEIEDIQIISEPDNGIYDAMNKGVNHARGLYVIFMNLGDCFYNSRVLLNVAPKARSGGEDIIYGDVMWGNKLIKHPYKITELFLLNEHMICHQAIFAKRSLLKEFPFELKYKVCADRVWMIRSLRSGASYRKVDEIIAYYDINGFSSHYINYGNDSLLATKDCYGSFAVIYVRIKRKAGRIIRKIIDIY